MKTKTLNKVSTWLPGFDGFYGSLWDDGQEDQEIENINNERKRKGLEPITYDDCKWDYTTFFKTLSEDIARVVSNYLKKASFIGEYEFEKLASPKEYNFSNDSIHVIYTLDSENEKAIRGYLKTNKKEFKEYLKNHYTSYDGFISSYSNDVNVWLNDDYLTHKHKLGAVLNFILKHHLKNEENIDDIDIWIYEQTNDSNYICASNFDDLTKDK